MHTVSETDEKIRRHVAKKKEEDVATTGGACDEKEEQEEKSSGGQEPCRNRTIRALTQRLVEAIVAELNRDEMRTCVHDRVISPLIDIMNQEDTKRRVNDHIIGPLIRLMYTQMFPYLIVAAIVLLSGLVMWVLMFTMFTLTYFRK